MATIKIDTHRDHFILFDTATRRYYSLDSMAAMVWKLVQRPRSIREMRDAIVEHFGLEPEVAERDLRKLLDEMQSSGLIETETD